jgi:hypothetical protein
LRLRLPVCKPVVQSRRHQPVPGKITIEENPPHVIAWCPCISGSRGRKGSVRAAIFASF